VPVFVRLYVSVMVCPLVTLPLYRVAVGVAAPL